MLGYPLYNNKVLIKNKQKIINIIYEFIIINRIAKMVMVTGLAEEEIKDMDNILSMSFCLSKILFNSFNCSCSKLPLVVKHYAPVSAIGNETKFKQSSYGPGPSKHVETTWFDSSISCVDFLVYNTGLKLTG